MYRKLRTFVFLCFPTLIPRSNIITDELVSPASDPFESMARGVVNSSFQMRTFSCHSLKRGARKTFSFAA